MQWIFSNVRWAYKKTNTHDASKKNDRKCQESSLQRSIYSCFFLFFSDERGVKVRQLDWTTDDLLRGQIHWRNILFRANQLVLCSVIFNIQNATFLPFLIYTLKNRKWVCVFCSIRYLKCKFVLLHCYKWKEMRVKSEFIGSCHFQMWIQNSAGVRTRYLTSTITPRSSSQQMVSDHDQRSLCFVRRFLLILELKALLIQYMYILINNISVHRHWYWFLTDNIVIVTPQNERVIQSSLMYKSAYSCCWLFFLSLLSSVLWRWPHRCPVSDSVPHFK